MKNVDTLAVQHEYIALVKIIEITTSNLQVQTIRQYKGEIKSTINVFGNTNVNPLKIAGNPSLQIGDTWLVFSTQRKQNDFRPFQAKILSSSDHFINRSTHSGLNIEKRLSEIFKFEKLNIYQDVFNSGQTKSELSYKDKVRNGRKTFYYPSGKKYRIVKFKKGKLNGKTIEYCKNGRKSLIIRYKNDTIYSKSKYGSKETIFLTRHEEFKKKEYCKKVRKAVLISQDQSKDTLIRFVKKSEYKNMVISYNYDEYFNHLTRSPEFITTEVNVSVKHNPKKLGQKRREIISTNNLRINGKKEVIITYLEFDEDWFDEKRKIVFFSKSYGIFKEIWSDKIFEIENGKHIKKLIDKTYKIVSEHNL